MLTTLELARALAQAAHAEFPDADAAAVAILETMRKTDSWFCYRYENQQGLSVDIRYEPPKLWGSDGDQVRQPASADPRRD
jgi:hypothetical protein